MQLVNWLAVEAIETVQLRLIADREVNKSQKQTVTPRFYSYFSTLDPHGFWAQIGLVIFKMVQNGAWSVFSRHMVFDVLFKTLIIQKPHA